MNKSILAILILAFCCSACGGVTHSPQAVRLTEGLDPPTETIDNECAYFYFMWGRTAELDGKLEEGREAYEKALVCDLHNIHIMRRLAVLLINMDKKKDAANWIKKIVEEDPEDKASRAYLANLYLTMDQPDEAEEIYLDILKNYPQDYDNMLQLGSLYARQDKFAKALEILENLVKLNPISFVGHHYLAKIYMATAQPAKARQAFAKALELNWSPFLAFEAASFLERNGFNEEALQIFRQIVEDDESNEQIRTMIVALLLRMDLIDEAIVEFEELLPFASDVARIEINLSRLLIDRKRYDEAISQLQDALAENPDLREARILIALAYHEKGEKDEAVRILQEIGPLDEDYEDATLFLARILAADKKFAAAGKLLKERIGNPDSRRKSFYPALATVFQQQQKTAEVEIIFQEALKLYPDDTEILLEYALIKDEQEDVDGAMAAMAKILAINPDEPYALNYIGYNWAERGEKLEMAHDYILKALEIKPDDGFILDSLGWVLFKMGRLDEALVELNKSLAKEPGDPTINEHVGDVYHKLGNVQQARAAWEKSLDLQKDDKKKEQLRKKLEAAAK